MGDVEAVKAKVQKYLISIFGGVGIDSDGDFWVRRGSARLYLRVVTVGTDADAPTFIILFTPLLRGVNDGPELHKYVAYHADDYRFGHLSLHQNDEGVTFVYFTHQLLGDYLDEPELGYAASGMLGTADEIDDELQVQFGGTRFHEK
jgi:hypothetical protein